MLRNFFNPARNLAQNIRDLEKSLIAQGVSLSRGYAKETYLDLRDTEFQIFSQWGEDGIIQYLTQNIEIEARTFIEFGVETFREANCRFLMQKDFWSGLIIDGSEENIKKIKSSHFYWKYDLVAVKSFITMENIRDIVDRRTFDKVGILSVDIDGVDYHVLSELSHLDPSIIIVEYNGLYGPVEKVSVPYNPNFQRNSAHFSNLYYGASISAFEYLLSSWNYSLVAGNSAGNNAFFVRNDLLNEKVKAISVGQAYQPTSFAEGRDAEGNLTFLRGDQRRTVIADLPLVNVETGERLCVGELQHR